MWCCRQWWCCWWGVRWWWCWEGVRWCWDRGWWVSGAGWAMLHSEWQSARSRDQCSHLGGSISASVQDTPWPGPHILTLSWCMISHHTTMLHLPINRVMKQYEQHWDPCKWILSVRCDNHALNIAIYMLQLKRRRCLITEYILKNDEVISLWWCWTCSSPQRRWETIKNRFVLFVVASLRSGKKQCLLSQSSSASPLSSPWSSPTPTPRDSTTTCWATTTDWSDPWPTTRTRSLSRWGSNYLSWWTWWAWLCFIVSFIVLG